MTKKETLEHTALLRLLEERNRECAALRLRLSIADGELALRPRIHQLQLWKTK